MKPFGDDYETQSDGERIRAAMLVANQQNSTCLQGAYIEQMGKKPSPIVVLTCSSECAIPLTGTSPPNDSPGN